jgi:UDP-GlcNAc:undecaprenyl-phosphate GlcNAc-1-phosphate transferase
MFAIRGLIMALTYLISFVSSTLLACILTWSVRNRAKLCGWATPPAAHHIHKSPIPRLGGVAIYLSFVTVAGLLMAGSPFFGFDALQHAETFLLILAPGTLIFLFGLYDDLRPLSAYVKFGVQTMAAALLFLGGFRVVSIPLLFGHDGFGWLELPVTIFWVLWITNAFNLIDGLDGLAAGSAMFSTMTVFVVSLVSENYLVSLLTVTLAGSILGFLRFNFNPATIFLGDSGSQFIGFMLSALALVGAGKSSTVVAVAIPVVSFGLPLLETGLSVLRRFLSGQPLFSADRQHIHHKLLERGFSHRQVVVILYGVSALFGLLSLILLSPGGATVGIVLFIVGAGIWIGVQHLGYHEVHELQRVARRTIDQKQIIVNNLAIRRATERLPEAMRFLDLCTILQEAFEANDFDSFYLSVTPESAAVSAFADSHERRFTTGDLACERQFAWHKPDGLSHAPAQMWTLTLELITTKGKRCGSFSLHRASNRKLLIDVNLLTSRFHVALADALDRVTQMSRQPARQNLSPGPLLTKAEQDLLVGSRGV